MEEKAADGTDRREPGPSEDGARVERRRHRRDAETPPDWEMIVLQRMAERVKSLSSEPVRETSTGSDGNWEEAALLTLRRRMKDIRAK